MSENGIKVDFRVVRSDRRTTKNGDPYYALELLDVNGDKHEARIWNDVLAGIKGCYLPQEGQYWGNVQSYENVFKGQKQLVVTDYWICQPDEIPEEVKEKFAEQPVIDVDRVIDRMFLWPFWDQEMLSLMVGVTEHLRKDRVWDKIREIPAGAMYHHNVRGGFLLHIDELLDFSESLCNVSLSDDGKLVVKGPTHYPGLIDYQILRAAIVLHDIGKVYDYDEKTLQFQSNPISECLEHTIVGILMVDRFWPNTTSETMDRGLRLTHALAAHHGPELGAVKPKTPEAVVLHHIDMMSAHLDVCRRAYGDAKKTGALPEYSRMMGVKPFVPGFFPPEISTYSRKEEVDKLTIEKTEPETERPEKLPWEN
jgi:3'-5' exoribonuclease